MARAAYGACDPARIDANVWWEGVKACLAAQCLDLRRKGIDPRDITRIGVDGTSGTMVLTDVQLQPVTPALMYNSKGFLAEAEAIARFAPDPHISQGSNSATARALRLIALDAGNNAAHLMHQADFIAARLMRQGGVSDHNNSLKTGFDPETGMWPEWFSAAGMRRHLLPEVLPAGAAVRPIDPAVAAQLGLAPDVIVHVGTTDSIAAFLAAAPLQIGAAVTSLGTTLAVKLLSDTRIDAPEIGLYSHRLGDGWLVGGASNTGGGVLAGLFSVADIEALCARIDPAQASDLDYYPLSTPGERFPVNDSDLAPRMTPQPADDAAYLHGLLESIARIEALCYAQMAVLGAPAPARLLTAGGGAANDVWTAIRSRVLGCNIQRAPHAEAAIGTARLIASVQGRQR